MKKSRLEIPNELLQCCRADFNVARHVYQSIKKTTHLLCPKEWKIEMLLSTALQHIMEVRILADISFLS